MQPTEKAAEISVRRLSIEEFSGMQAEWRSLLERSAADPLFMSWEWLYSWWETWNTALQAQLFLLAVYRNNQLSALAPFFIYKRRLKIGLELKELHFLGNAWRIASTVRTEYVDIIADRRYPNVSMRALAEYLTRNCSWDLIAISDHKIRSSLQNFQILAGQIGLSPLIRNYDRGIRLDTTGDFSGWLAQLGANTRLKVYNRRGYLHETYRSVRLREETDPAVALQLLNNFHHGRWGKPCFADASLEFHRRFLRKLVPPAGRACFSVLEVDERPISLLYDVRIGDRIYNIQAGFDEKFDKKISPGTLHLGYAIESAFRQPSIRYYDLLAGSGKTTFYKSHFKGRVVHFETGQYVRTPWLILASRIYRALPRRLTRSLIHLLD